MEFAVIPKFFLKWFTTDSLRQYHGNVLITNLMLLAVVFSLNGLGLKATNHLPHYCFMDEWLGIHCPGCGMTRAFIAISEGAWKQAFQYNSASIPLFLLIMLQVPIRLAFLLTSSGHQQLFKLSKISNKVVIAIILITWLLSL